MFTTSLLAGSVRGLLHRQQPLLCIFVPLRQLSVRNNPFQVKIYNHLLQYSESRNTVSSSFLVRKSYMCFINTRTQASLSNNHSKNAQGIHENISTLQIKKRPQRRRNEEDHSKPGFWNVVAYSSAEEYDLEKLAIGLREQDLYQVCPLQTDAESRNQTGLHDIVRARARYQVGTEPRELIFFREGSVVLWNLSELEVDNVLQFVRQYEHNSYDTRLMAQESEAMKYTHAPPGKKTHLDSSTGCMVLSDENDNDTVLDRYTFSNAMALSVKLGIWEASLDRYVDSIEFVTEDLKQGTRISMSRGEVLQKTGQLFALRHLINLSSDLLDTPDFYWDRDQQESLYLQTCGYFSIARRTKPQEFLMQTCQLRGYPDSNTRRFIQHLWQELGLPTYALVDADPHGIDIMCVYRFGSLAMSSQADSMATPALRWLGIFPSDIALYSAKSLPLTQADYNKIKDLESRPYIKNNPRIKEELEILKKHGRKAEIEGIAGISQAYLTDVYLPEKLNNKDCI